MNALLEQQGNSRFDFLAFPCNQFGWQEPGKNRTEILNGLKYVRPGKGFEPNFEMMAKIDVNGKKESPLYTFLKKSCRSPRGAKFNKQRLAWDIIKADDITWNFEKFLINIDGVPVARFLPEKTPEYIFNLLVPLINSHSTSVYSLPALLRERCQNREEARRNYAYGQNFVWGGRHEPDLVYEDLFGRAYEFGMPHVKRNPALCHILPC